MKKVKFIFLILTVLFSCSDEKDGDWDDNIELSQKQVEFTAAENSVVITTKGEGWWIIDVSLDGRTDFEQTENSSGDFLMDENEFLIERRSPKELYIEMSANTTDSERKLLIGLQNGNYFDGVTITQSAK